MKKKNSDMEQHSTTLKSYSFFMPTNSRGNQAWAEPNFTAVLTAEFCGYRSYNPVVYRIQLLHNSVVKDSGHCW